MNIVFAGTPEFAAQHLEGLMQAGVPIKAVVTQPDKPGKRGKKLVPSAVKKLAEENNLPVLQPTKFSTDDLEDLNCDLLIVVAYGQILRQALLDAPTFGCINVHGSVLPRWRGAAPIQRAIEAGDSETGICIMQMDAGLDTGPVLYEARTPIATHDTSADLSDELANLGIQGLIRVIAEIESENMTPKQQPADGATYAKKIDKAEAKLDWSQPGLALVRKIHAFNPDPVCYCELPQDSKSLRMKVYRAEVCYQNEKNHSSSEVAVDAVPVDNIEGANENIAPGTISQVSPEGITVTTIDGSIRLKQIQLPLGKGSILSGRDVLNARSDLIHPGVKLT